MLKKQYEKGILLFMGELEPTYMYGTHGAVRLVYLSNSDSVNKAWTTTIKQTNICVAVE